MTERERLIELLKEGSTKAGEHIREVTKKVLAEKGRFNSSTDCDRHNIYEIEADYLLENGVVVPPFEIGAKLYAVITNMHFVPDDVYECEVVWYALGEDGIRPTVKIKSDNILNGANLGLYPEDLFLTKEEAEQALKGGAE